MLARCKWTRYKIKEYHNGISKERNPNKTKNGQWLELELIFIDLRRKFRGCWIIHFTLLWKFRAGPSKLSSFSYFSFATFVVFFADSTPVLNGGSFEQALNTASFWNINRTLVQILFSLYHNPAHKYLYICVHISWNSQLSHWSWAIMNIHVSSDRKCRRKVFRVATKI